jgi:thiamine biosynthesis lipoprotein
VIAQMSQWEPLSDISRFNRAEAGSWHQLPDEFFHVLRAALALAEETAGAYDPTIGTLSEVWGFGASGRKADAPEAEAVDRARQACGWQALALDVERKAARQPGGVALDFSSIAKGFAVDLVAEALTRHGFSDHLVEIGGELRGTGTKPDGSPWWVALEEPEGSSDETIVALHALSVATSGDSRRYIEAGGRRLSHTIDPRSGWPIRDTLAAVTVFHASCMGGRWVRRGPDGPRERITPAFAAMLD